MADRETVIDMPEVGACCAVYVNTAGVEAIAAQLPPPDAFHAMAETFKLLGDPTRLRVVYALSRGELCVCDLAAMLGVGATAISNHLRLLRNMRLVRYRRQGKLVYYTLDDAHIGQLLSICLNQVQEPRMVGGVK